MTATTHTRQMTTARRFGPGTGKSRFISLRLKEPVLARLNETVSDLNSAPETEPIDRAQFLRGLLEDYWQSHPTCPV